MKFNKIHFKQINFLMSTRTLFFFFWYCWYYCNFKDNLKNKTNIRASFSSYTQLNTTFFFKTFLEILFLVYFFDWGLAYVAHYFFFVLQDVNINQKNNKNNCNKEIKQIKRIIKPQTPPSPQPAIVLEPQLSIRLLVHVAFGVV